MLSKLTTWLNSKKFLVDYNNECLETIYNLKKNNDALVDIVGNLHEAIKAAKFESAVLLAAITLMHNGKLEISKDFKDAVLSESANFSLLRDAGENDSTILTLVSNQEEINE